MSTTGAEMSTSRAEMSTIGNASDVGRGWRMQVTAEWQIGPQDFSC